MKEKCKLEIINFLVVGTSHMYFIMIIQFNSFNVPSFRKYVFNKFDEKQKFLGGIGTQHIYAFVFIKKIGLCLMEMEI